MLELDDLVKACENHLMLAHDISAADSRNADLLRIALLTAAAAVVCIGVLVTHSLVDAVSHGNGGSTRSVQFMFVMLLNDLHVKTSQHFGCVLQKL